MTNRSLKKSEVCIVCDEAPVFSWTDTHGIAQCRCGTPYRLYHYEGEGDQKKRVEKEPECVVLDAWVPLLRQYREETKHKIPGGFSFAPEYEVAQPHDFEAFKAWCDKNRASIDAIKEAA